MDKRLPAPAAPEPRTVPSSAAVGRLRAAMPRAVVAFACLLAVVAPGGGAAQGTWTPPSPPPPPATAPDGPLVEVDVELVLAVDISRSMDVEELALQRAGYVAAFRDPAVHRAVAGGLLGRVAVLYFEWAGPAIRNVIGGWRLIDGPESAGAFAADLEAGAVTAALGTSISAALDHAAGEMARNRFEGLRRVIDVSGDGPNNSGAAVEASRDAVVGQGITINGIPVMLKAYDGPFSLSNLDVYYEDCVIGGAQSFVLPVRSAEAFAPTIRRKLILEIAGLRPPPALAGRPRLERAQAGLGLARPAPRIDCLIGEKRRMEWIRNRGWDW